MFSSGNKFSKVIRIIIDILNVALGLGVVVLAVMTFMNTKGNAWMFPFIFLMGGLMNLLTGIKHLMNDRRADGIVLEVAAVILFAVAYASYRAVGGL